MTITERSVWKAVGIRNEALWCVRDWGSLWGSAIWDVYGARDYGVCGGYRLDCPSLCAEVRGDQLGKFIAVVQEMMMVWKGLKQ